MGNNASTGDSDSYDSSFESGDELSFLNDFSDGEEDEEDSSEFESDDDDDEDSSEYDSDDYEEENYFDDDEEDQQQPTESSSKPGVEETQQRTNKATSHRTTPQQPSSLPESAVAVTSIRNSHPNIDEKLQNSDLFQLLIDEVAIQTLKSLTRETILVEYKSRRPAMKQAFSSSFSKKTNISSNDDNNNNNNNKFDVAKHTETAMEMLEACPELNDLRFQLVPGRIKEHAFWYTVFAMVLTDQYNKTQEGGKTTLAADNNDDDDEQNPEQTPEDQVDSSYSNNINNGVATTTTQPQKQQQQHQQTDLSVSTKQEKLTTSPGVQSEQQKKMSPSSSRKAAGVHQPSSTYSRSYREVMTSGSNAAVVELHDQIKGKNQELKKMSSDLEKANEQIKLLQQEVQNLQQQQHDRAAAGPSKSSNTNGVRSDSSSSASLGGTKIHKGKWIMDQDSKDFLELEDEIKQNLRQEKERRLKEVRDQMKFILDTDHISHSFGEWDCCNAPLYNAEGCTDVVEE
mmetsp:Transcript_18998/g.29257  ORF Transcript_18998/g.29257 Transcript_18998/m.29257 type:complete len:513 (-) Transcript_18998:160-1698(-)